MTWTVIAVLILIGLIFIILEILVIPGVAVFGILGFIIILVGVWQSYVTYGATAGHIVLGSSLLLSVLALVFSLRSKTWKRMMLNSKIDGKTNIIDEHKIKAGDTGKTTSRLSPAGKAFINGDFYEVHTQSEFIDPGIEIIITKIVFNKIYVKQKK
ncbi:MAG: hypothetical protein K8R41_07285 [Bacteroidales bacterium]|nr:hypothetical protein [Bacteroidales bacterium]